MATEACGIFLCFQQTMERHREHYWRGRKRLQIVAMLLLKPRIPHSNSTACPPPKKTPNQTTTKNQRKQNKNPKTNKPPNQTKNPSRQTTTNNNNNKTKPEKGIVKCQEVVLKGIILPRSCAIFSLDHVSRAQQLSKDSCGLLAPWASASTLHSLSEEGERAPACFWAPEKVGIENVCRGLQITKLFLLKV